MGWDVGTKMCRQSVVALYGNPIRSAVDVRVERVHPTHSTIWEGVKGVIIIDRAPSTPQAKLFHRFYYDYYYVSTVDEFSHRRYP